MKHSERDLALLNCCTTTTTTAGSSSSIVVILILLIIITHIRPSSEKFVINHLKFGRPMHYGPRH